VQRPEIGLTTRKFDALTTGLPRFYLLNGVRRAANIDSSTRSCASSTQRVLAVSGKSQKWDNGLRKMWQDTSDGQIQTTIWFKSRPTYFWRLCLTARDLIWMCAIRFGFDLEFVMICFQKQPSRKSSAIEQNVGSTEKQVCAPKLSMLCYIERRTMLSSVLQMTTVLLFYVLSSLTLSFTPGLKPTRFTNPTLRSFTSSSRTASTDYCLDRLFWATRFLFLFFLNFCVSVSCVRLTWPSRQLFNARWTTVL